MAYRTKLPDDAEILAAYDWTPADVLAARTDPSRYWPGMHEHWSKRLDDDPASDGDAGRRRAALMALAEETARYHDNRASLAREVRTLYMADLTQRLPKEQRWSHEKVGLVLNLTKQRVQQILRNTGKYSRDPNMSVALIPGQGSAAIEVVTEERRRKLARIFGGEVSLAKGDVVQIGSSSRRWKVTNVSPFADGVVDLEAEDGSGLRERPMKDRLGNVRIVSREDRP